jgi:alpha-galactosidase
MSERPLRPALHPALSDGRVEIVAETGAACTYAVTVTANEPLLITPDIGRIALPPATALQTYDSSWGYEYEPRDLPVDAPTTIEISTGRSTQGGMPWLAVGTADGWWVLTVHWSGNWRISTTPGAGEVVIEVGLHPDGQQPALDVGETFTLPEVSIGWGPDRAAAAAALVRHLARPTRSLPVEWNHWWPYEDALIDEDVFLAEAEAAADLGFEIAVLDAGWFGRAEAGSDWVAERGDWHRVNTARFPHGLAWLADQTRARGVEFGIWIEAEALGPKATIATERPELVAHDQAGRSLGYVCLGSSTGRDHVVERVDELITTTGARWIKWDFNLDPGRGCVRDDHGHTADDGLLRHYLGLYAVLDQLRDEHRETIFEACSSGGLRIDAGLAAHVDAFFLSDPDWTEHHLTCLWGAAGLLAPAQILHWMESEWRGEHRFQKIDYSGTLLTRPRFDTRVRAAMLHRFGASIRLTHLRPDLRERLADHLRGYRDQLRPLVEAGVLVPLTEQPLRNEQGNRQPATRC